jgi:hypothetical protein
MFQVETLARLNLSQQSIERRTKRSAHEALSKNAVSGGVLPKNLCEVPCSTRIGLNKAIPESNGVLPAHVAAGRPNLANPATDKFVEVRICCREEIDRKPLQAMVIGEAVVRR